MSGNIRKCVCLGPAGFTSTSSYQNYKVASNRLWMGDSRTSWVRLWVDWYELMQSSADFDPDPQVFTKNPDHPFLANLDAQIVAARQDGRSVALAVMHKFPAWVNGTADVNQIPNNRTPTGAWGSFIRFLYRRYKPFYPRAGASDIQLLEIMNEPNLKFNPKDAALAGKVVEMCRTAQSISAEFDHQLHIGGPGLSDRDAATADEQGNCIPWGQFMDSMKATGFRASSNFVWTHHNYGDVERNSNSSIAARDKLWSWWSGYDEGDGPVVFCTEGGARMWVIGEGNFTQQASLVGSNYQKLWGASRMGMETNYLMYDAQVSDSNGVLHGYSGLRGVSPWGDERPVYQTWKSKQPIVTGLNKWRSKQLLPPWTKWDPGMLSQHPGHLEIFAVGSNNELFHTWTGNNGGSWSAWESLGGGCTSGPGVVSIKDGMMDVFVLGDAGGLWHKWWTSGGGWSGWDYLGGWCSFDPAVCHWGDQQIEVFVRVTDGTLWHRWWTAGGGWGPWLQLWAGQVAGSPSAVSWSSGRNDVVFKGNDNAIHHMYYDGSWHGPNPIGAPGGGPAVSHPEITSWKAGHLDVICGGPGGKLWRKTYDRVWSDWEPIPHSFGHQFGPAAVSQNYGQIDIAFQKNGNAMQHISLAM